MEFVRAGGDLCLVCHREDYILQAEEELIRTADRDSKFTRRVAEAARRVLAFKKKSVKLLHAGRGAGATQSPPCSVVEKLSRRLWEFGEQVRLEPFSRQADKRRAHS